MGTRFMSGKLLMFVKSSLKSFIYDIIETCFQSRQCQGNFQKVWDQVGGSFYVLTDIDNTYLKFMFISNPNSETPESKCRDIIFEIITSSQLYKRFDRAKKKKTQLL